VCFTGYGISSLLFNLILVTIINPDNIQPHTLIDGRKMYPREVADNLPKALIILGGVLLAIGLFGLFLMKPPVSEDAEDNSLV
jgi:hypothetical protein